MASDIYGFEGFLFDGDPANVTHAPEFFRSKKDACSRVVRQAWVTAEDINAILEQAGCVGEVSNAELALTVLGYNLKRVIAILSVSGL